MKPKPRERPVLRSIITTASVTSPKPSKYWRKLVSVTEGGSPPQKIFLMSLNCFWGPWPVPPQMARTGAGAWSLGTARFTSSVRPSTECWSAVQRSRSAVVGNGWWWWWRGMRFYVLSSKPFRTQNNQPLTL